MKLLERLNPFRKSAEGSYRGPATGWSHWGNPFSIPFGDGFQRGLTMTRDGAERVATTYACVTQTARAVSLCEANHFVGSDDGETVSTTSPASRLLRYPNSYQTFGQFIYNVVAQMLLAGEAFALIVRDDRYAATALHLWPVGSCTPAIDPTTGEVFYNLGNNPMVPQQPVGPVPARDVIHFRQHTPRHPLVGESPLSAAALAMGVNVALSESQLAFFNQMARPSGVLSTDLTLSRAQIKELRDAFDDQASGMNQGKIPILGGGLKFSPMGISASDSQLLESQRFSVEEIARCFGVPLLLIGAPSSQSASSSESLINFWLSTALGALFENLECTLERAFNLPASDSIEFDEKALLRTDLVARIEAYTKGVQGGIYAPNEARGFEGLPKLDGGDTLFLQRQMTPVDLLTAMSVAELEAAQNPPAPDPAPAPASEPDDTEDDPAPTVDAEVTAALVHDLIRRKRL